MSITKATKNKPNPKVLVNWAVTREPSPAWRRLWDILISEVGKEKAASHPENKVDRRDHDGEVP